jgi:DNA-directed RNA polymerase subunit RPC12/RpoP
MFCPQCGSTRLRRSRTRGFREKFLKIFGYRAYRCREDDCGWRGLLKTREVGERLFNSIEKKKMPLILAIIMLLVCYLLYLLLKKVNVL